MVASASFLPSVLLVIIAVNSVISTSGGIDQISDGDRIYELKYHSFQIKVPRWTKECFYQEFEYNTSAAIIWHVVSSGGGSELAATATFTREADGKELYTSAYGQMGEFKDDDILAGVYEICISNEYSVTSKTVYVWFHYQIPKIWNFEVEQEMNVKQYQYNRDLLRDIIRNIDMKMRDMSYYQTIYREKNIYHELAMQGLETVINWRSLIALVLSLTTAMLQVIFVRKLFSTSGSKATPTGI